MDIFKHFLFTFFAILFLLGLWAFDQISGQSFTDWFFPHFGDRGKTLISQFVFIVAFSGASFKFGKDWHSYFKPITKFKMFLKKKIKQGEKLNNSKLEDIVTRKVEMKEPITWRDGTVMTHKMDETQIIPFKDCYSKWRMQVSEGLNLVLLPEHIDLRWEDGHLPSDLALMQSDFRKGLVLDIESIKKLEDEVKSFWFQEKANIDALTEQKEIKCP